MSAERIRGRIQRDLLVSVPVLPRTSRKTSNECKSLFHRPFNPSYRVQELGTGRTTCPDSPYVPVKEITDPLGQKRPLLGLDRTMTPGGPSDPHTQSTSDDGGRRRFACVSRNHKLVDTVQPEVPNERTIVKVTLSSLVWSFSVSILGRYITRNDSQHTLKLRSTKEDTDILIYGHQTLLPLSPSYQGASGVVRDGTESGVARSETTRGTTRDPTLRGQKKGEMGDRS